MRILLAEDHADLSDWLARALRAAGFTVDVMADGVAADQVLASEDYALALLDLSLPRLDGMAVLSRLRARGQHVPVLIITARSDLADRVSGLERGADDYLVKPFELEELLARVKALLRRSQAQDACALNCGALSFDTGSRGFSLAGEPLPLTRREHAVLEMLMLHRNRPVGKTQLFEQVFGLDEAANLEAIELYVHRVRKKIVTRGVTIQTLRGLGYMLRAEGP